MTAPLTVLGMVVGGFGVATDAVIIACGVALISIGWLTRGRRWVLPLLVLWAGIGLATGGTVGPGVVVIVVAVLAGIGLWVWERAARARAVAES